MTSGNRVVTFDVGGKLFKVAQFTLEKHPDCMLSVSASARWRSSHDGATDDETAFSGNSNASIATPPIYIDANPDRFSLVLDFMRYGKVYVPPSVPRGAVQDDLDYFNLDWDPEQIVSQDGRGQLRTVMERLEQYKRDKEDRYLQFAAWCFEQYASKWDEDDSALHDCLHTHSASKKYAEDFPLRISDMARFDHDLATRCFAQASLQITVKSQVSFDNDSFSFWLRRLH